MKALKLFAAAFTVTAAVACSNLSMTTISPDRSIRADVSGQTITVRYNGATVFNSIHVGLKAEGSDLDTGLTLRDVSRPRLVRDRYTLVSGKRLRCRNSAWERTYTYVNPMGETLSLLLRLYNDGLALRYVTAGGMTVTDDRTSFSIAEGVDRWIAPLEDSFEQPYPHATDGTPVSGRPWSRTEPGRWGYPALVEPCEGVFALITEADLRHGDSASWLDNSADPEVYEVTLTGSAAFNGSTSPWRCAIIGSLQDIVGSTLVTDLSSPSRISDTGWIEPGVSSWIYWAFNHSSKDFEVVKQYIDLAAGMGWPYCLVDWEWPEMGNGGDIEDVLAYARSKGVRVNLWYNSGTSWTGPGSPQPQDRLNSAENRKKEMAWLERAGAAGIKVDFFSPDSASMTDYYLDILEDAAERHLLVDFHGCTVPHGWRRTWPNLMSMEAVYGAEWYNNGPFFTPAAAVHNATIPFTRNVIGPMYYTQGTFTDSQFPHITTNAHELALPVLFESGLQHMPDRPEGYASLPDKALEVYSALPAVWDDTRLLAGYPGESAVIARRSGNRWYIAGINGLDEPADISFSLGRIGRGRWTSVLFRDGDSDRDIDVSELTAGDGAVTVHCLPRGGFLAVIDRLPFLFTIFGKN